MGIELASWDRAWKSEVKWVITQVTELNLCQNTSVKLWFGKKYGASQAAEMRVTSKKSLILPNSCLGFVVTGLKPTGE